MTFKTLDDADLNGKRTLIRVDLNVPMDDGKVTDDTRLRAHRQTIVDASDKGAKVILLAHFGRPKGKIVPELSLEPVVQTLSDVLDREVAFARHDQMAEGLAHINEMANGDVLLLDNVRFNPGEEKNDPEFAKRLASIGDAVVLDAFSCAHRAHASTEGIARLLPAYAGRSMQQELEALGAALEKPEHPVMAVVGGAKVSTKIDLLENLVAKVDTLVIGGGMANTFLAAQGVNVGKSLCEHDLADTARRIMGAADAANCTILLPSDVVVAKEFKANAANRTIGLNDVAEDEMILDAGPETVAAIGSAIEASKTLVWNGPLGAFEIAPFDAATVAAAQAAAKATKAGTLLSVAGGGDTVAALNHAQAAGDFSYISTAGGAFLEWLEGKTLPGVAALAQAD